jgi:tetratricopeptide (TPR) repeat protein
MGESREIDNPRVGRRLWVIGLLAATAAAFLPVLQNDFVNYDDPFTLKNNVNLTSPDVLTWAFTTNLMGHYQPLAWLTWSGIVSAFGATPAALHALSLIVHLVNTALIYLLALQLARACQPTLASRRASEGGRLVALGTSAAFALHPMRVEVVAWASAFPYALSLAWLLGATLAYLHYASATATPVARRAFAISLFCYACSLLSRSIALAYPIVLLVLDVYPLRRRNRWLEKFPFLGLALLAAVAEATSRESTGLEEVGVGARLTAAVSAPFLYLARTIWPSGYSPLEARPLQPETEWTPLFLGAAGLCVVSFAVWRARYRWPVFAAVWVAFILLLVPAIGLTPSGQQSMANRYAYFPAVALSFVAGGLLSQSGSTRLARRSLIVVALAAGCALSAMTMREISWWRNSVTLWSRALAIDGSNDIATFNLAVALEEAGRSDEAIARYQQSLALVPDHMPARNALTALQAKRGLALMKNGQFTEAAADLRAAVAQRPADLTLINALSFALVQAGQSKQAVEILKQGLKSHADNDDLAHNLARLLATSPDPIVRDGDLALRLAMVVRSRTGGRDPRVLDTLAAAYAAAGQPGAARKTSTEAVALANQLGQPELAAEIRTHPWSR